jgi:hypothetical protein
MKKLQISVKYTNAIVDPQVLAKQKDVNNTQHNKCLVILRTKVNNPNVCPLFRNAS